MNEITVEEVKGNVEVGDRIFWNESGDSNWGTATKINRVTVFCGKGTHKFDDHCLVYKGRITKALRFFQNGKAIPAS